MQMEMTRLSLCKKLITWLKVNGRDTEFVVQQ